MREYRVTYIVGPQEVQAIVMARSEIEAVEVFRRKHPPACIIRKVNLN